MQGLDAAAPFHPTALGQLAIALADQEALPKAEGLVPAPTPTPTSSPGANGLSVGTNGLSAGTNGLSAGTNGLSAGRE